VVGGGRTDRGQMFGSQASPKSIGAETTFDIDVSDVDTLRRTLLSLSTKVGARLRRAEQVGRTVAIKVRLADFRTLSRSRTLAVPTDVAREIFAAAWALFEALAAGDRIRLLGVRMEGLEATGDTPRQPALDERPHGWRDAEVAADAAAQRYGTAVVRPASLIRGTRSDHGARGVDPTVTPASPHDGAKPDKRYG
jgi:DNA polymerase-4